MPLVGSSTPGALIRGLVFGTFDCIHPGHLDHLKDSRMDCDKLTVVIDADIDVIARKGYIQHDAATRQEILEALPDVDQVLVATPAQDLELNAFNPASVIEGFIEAYPNDRIVIFSGPGQLRVDDEPIDGATYVYSPAEKQYSASKMFDDARAMKMRNLAKPIEGSVTEEYSENDYVVLDDCQIIDHPALD